MQIETFKDAILSKLKTKVTPLFEKASVLFQSIQSNLTEQQRTQEKTAFFASLIQFIRMNVQSNSYDNMDAQLLLLNWLIPLISIGVIRKLMPTLIELMQTVATQASDAQLSVGVIGQIMNLATKEDLQQSQLHELYSAVLAFTINPKKPIRKQAHKVLHQFLEQRTLDIVQDGFYMAQLRQHLNINLAEKNESASYSISLLAQVNKVIPYSLLADSLYVIIDNIQTTEQSMQPYVFLALETILESRIGEDQAEKLLSQLLLLQPDELNAQHSYLQCLRQCLICLNVASPLQAATYLPATISNMLEYLLQDNLKLQKHAKAEIMKVVEICGAKTLQLNRDINSDLMTMELDSAGSVQVKYMAIMRYLLSNRFDHINVLDIISVFLSTVNERVWTHVCDFVVELVANKSRWPIHQFQNAFGALAAVMPLKVLLQQFPIKLNVNTMALDFDEKSNSWILYILAKHSHGALEEYLDTLYPFLAMLQFIDQSNSSEQKLMLNIACHLLEIAGNCVVTTIKQAHVPKLIQFVDSIIQYLDADKPYYNTLLMMMAKLYSQFVSNPLTKSVLQNKSQLYISALAKIFMSSQQSDLTLAAIKIISYSADQTYLQKAITKNIDKLIEQQQNLTDNNLKNMDIILSVVGALELNTDAWQKCMDFAKLLINVQPIQKKIYKFIHEIMRKVHYTFLDEVYQFLLEAECAPSSRQKRFAVISCLLEKQFGDNSKRFSIEDFQSFIQNFLPEIVVATRDKNQKTRNAVEKLLQLIGERLLDIEFLEPFTSMVFAGLAAQSIAMKADAIATVSIIVEMFYNKLRPQYIDEISNLILLMVKEQNNEIYRAVLDYVKVIVKNRASVLQVQYILSMLFNVDAVSRDKNTIILKRLLIRMVKAYGLKVISDSLPNDHAKLLKHAIKVEKRSKHKKTKEEDKQTKQTNTNTHYKRQQVDSDDAVDSDEEQKPKYTKPTTKQNKQKSDMDIEQEDTENNILLKYDHTKEKFHFEEPVRKTQLQKSKTKEENQQIVSFQNGKVVVLEEKQQLTGQKRRREVDEQEKDQDETIKKTKGKAKQKETVHVIKESGDVFKPKSSKTGGDVLIKGRPEPFAFIQLNPKALNKRFKQKAARTMQDVFTKKSGALAGLKSRK